MVRQLPATSEVRKRRPAIGRLAALLTGVALVAPSLASRPAQAAGELESMVRALCLSAFDDEMARAGKKPPQGMGDFACACFEQRLMSGGSIDAAKEECRQAAARRYPI